MSDTLQEKTVLHGKREYTIDRTLGVGGFGITYLATASVMVDNIPCKTPFAIKEFFASQVCKRTPDGAVTVNDDDIEAAAEFRQRFMDEAERLNGLDHKGVVRVNEIFEQNGTVYYVMEYLGGDNLTSYVKQHGGRLSEAEAMRIFTHLADALRYLHNQRINHLDVKPANIMMREVNGAFDPVLIDFGLALYYKSDGRMAQENMSVCCSDGFAPAEQYEGITSFSPEADIYALGAILLYMLTGLVPPVAQDMNEQWIDTRMDVNVSQDTRNIIKRCMARDPHKRYQCIGDMHILADEEQHTRVIGKPKPKTTPRNKVPAANHSKKKKDSSSTSNPQMRLIAYAVLGLLVIGALAWGVMQGFGGGRSHEDDVVVRDSDSVQVKEPVAVEDTTGQSTGGTTGQSTGGTTGQSTGGTTGQSIGGTTGQSIGGTTGQSIGGTTGNNGSATSNTLDLGYATYTGPMKNGVPHGSDGVLVFKQSHIIDSYDRMERVAAPGDRVQGRFRDGHIVLGEWQKADGTTESLDIGA